MPIERLDASAYRVPTEERESDGTFEWDATTLVVVEVSAGGACGLGYTYGEATIARLVANVLAEVVTGHDAMAIGSAYARMGARARNAMRPGLATMAISAIDVALSALKATLLGVSLATLLGLSRSVVPIYASAGFTSYELAELQTQLRGFRDAGISRVKMKVGREPAGDRGRVRAARAAIGDGVELFVDANGAYARKEALAFAHAFLDVADVRWFEEPVSSDDLEGLRLLRDAGPPGMAIAAGEYGYDPFYFRRMLDAGAVDVLQIDATRAGGITGFLRAAALSDAASIPVSAHCAPALHVAVCAAVPRLAHLEWFFDHQRLESMLFDGAVRPVGSALHPDLSRPGIGITLKTADAARFRI